MLPRDENPDGPGEGGPAPILAQPQTKRRLGLGTGDRGRAAPGTSFSFIPGTEEEEEPGCSQSILCRPWVPGHCCLPLPDPGAVGDGDASPGAVRWHLLVRGSSMARVVSACGTSGQRQGQAGPEPRGTLWGHRHAPLPAGLWTERGHGPSPVGGGRPRAPQPCWKGDGSCPGRMDEAGSSFGRVPSSCPWAPPARVHRPESCPTHPAQVPGWPDSAPRVRAAGACVCARRRERLRLRLPPDEGLRQRDPQEGGEQRPAACWQQDAVPGVSLLRRRVRVRPGTARPAGRPPARLGTGCWRRGAEIRASSAPAPCSCVPRHRLSFENLPSAVRSQGPARCLPAPRDARALCHAGLAGDVLPVAASGWGNCLRVSSYPESCLPVPGG